ncbi:hypothetical protein H920_18979 [Fukomys damarensis]|uniref:Uncharacterized protein n=1 Tax=Fukomys damarensis TaxID=885580 RepID=A0A091CPV3_FUKDA|nr:hypothetical protein H920_18979 [Fukomys damarensis]
MTAVRVRCTWPPKQGDPGGGVTSPRRTSVSAAAREASGGVGTLAAGATRAALCLRPHFTWGKRDFERTRSLRAEEPSRVDRLGCPPPPQEHALCTRCPVDGASGGLMGALEAAAPDYRPGAQDRGQSQSTPPHHGLLQGGVIVTSAEKVSLEWHIPC